MTKQTQKKSATKSTSKVKDFSPTRVSLAVAALASVSLVIFALLATFV